MAEASRTSLLHGEGRRARELGAVLGALAGTRGGDAPAPRALDDLAELLADPPAGGGRLVLESERVPEEDIGFVRRFLERSGWELLVVGDDPRERIAKRLLGLRGARWLPWPPDLDQLAALLEPAAAEGRRDRAPAARPARPRSATPDGGVELGGLLEELLAGRAVGGEAGPRYLYRSDASLPVRGERSGLASVFEGFLALAEACAGPGDAIGVRGREDGAEAVVGIDFPPGPLTDGDLPHLLEGPFEGDPGVRDGVEAAREAALGLEEAGGRVGLAPGRPGRLQLEVRMPRAAAAAS